LANAVSDGQTILALPPGFISFTLSARQGKKTTFRSITIDDREVEFSEGFTDLHTRVYEDILSGKGFGIDQTTSSIETVYNIRKQSPVGVKGDYHPFVKKYI